MFPALLLHGVWAPPSLAMDCSPHTKCTSRLGFAHDGFPVDLDRRHTVVVETRKDMRRACEQLLGQARVEHLFSVGSGDGRVETSLQPREGQLRCQWRSLQSRRVKV